MKAIRRVLRAIPILLGVLFLCGLAFLAAGRIDRTVEAKGAVRIERYQVVRPEVPGIVSAVPVRPGDTVRPGQALALLHDYDLDRDVLSVERQLLAVRSTLGTKERRQGLLTQSLQPVETRKEQEEIRSLEVGIERRTARIQELKVELAAERNRLKRKEELGRLGLISATEVEEARNLVAQGEWQLRQGELEEGEAKAELAARRQGQRLLGDQQQGSRLDAGQEIRDLELQAARLEDQLRQLRRLQGLHTLTAALSGVVVGPPPEDLVGRKAAGGEELFQVIDVQSIGFLAHVMEEQIVKIRPGQKAYVEIAGLPKRHFDVFLGRVRQVGEQPHLDEAQGRILYDVQIALDTPWAQLERGRFYLRNGMQGEAKIVYRAEATILSAIRDTLTGRE
jgi:multidrug resistance efflux pump